MAKARLVELDPDMTFAQAAERTVATRTDELFSISTGVLDTDEIEHVHDMRVASRRLRAALEVFAPCFPHDTHREVLREVKALADALGERRDPDVQIANLQHLRKRMPEEDHPGIDLLVARAREQQACGNVALREALEEALTRDLRGRLWEMAHA
jgi:CHAD domain-containing protein